jgi:predicted permease
MSLREWPGLRRVFRLPPSVRRVRADVDAELRFHIEGRIDELVARGMPRQDADREAWARFGDYRRIESEVERLDRGAHRRRTLAERLETVASDLRYSVRSLVRQPMFSGVVIATLTLGIATTTAIFHAVDRVVLHPLPYPEPERVVYLGWQWAKASDYSDALSPRRFQFWHDQSRVYDGLATSSTFEAALGEEQRGSIVRGMRVTKDFLRVVGAAPAIGRAFTDDELVLDGPRVAILSDALWRERFGADRGIVGHAIRLDGRPYTVIGVMPPAFEVAEATEWTQVLTPLAFTPTDLADSGNNYMVIGRLRRGVSATQIQDDNAAVFQRFRDAYPDIVQSDDRGVRITTYQAIFLRGLATPLWIMLGATAFVLLLACANVANLLLGRALSRQREFAVRAALGAGRGRIARQVILEMIVLGTISAVLATGAALMSVRGIVALANGSLLRESQLRLDPRVVVYTTLVTLLASLIVGASVALSATRIDLSKSLAEGGRSGTLGRRQRALRNALVSTESAIAMLLLAGAGLLISSFARVMSVDPGFAREGVFTAKIGRAPVGYDSAAAVRQFEQRVLDQLRATPGIVAVGATQSLPLERGWNLPMTVEGRDDATEGGMEWRAVSDGYFDALGVKLLAGRGLRASDDRAAPFVVVISESFAKAYWPGESPIGRRVVLGSFKGKSIGPKFAEPAREIVGIVPDLRDMSLEQRGVRHTAWVPRAQVPAALVSLPQLLVRATDAAVAASALRRAVSEADARMPAPDISSMNDIVSRSVSWRRFGMVLMTVFAVLALVLTCVGIYGVVSYTASQRVQEIGVRIALGAQPGSVIGLVVRQGVWPALTGFAIGLVAALALSRLIAGMLYGVGAHDPVSLGVVSAVLVGVAFVASYLPARRASRIDPLVALRAE